MNEIIKFETNTGTVELSADIIRKQISTNPKVSDSEINMFLNLCRYQKLNPFLKEAFLIKYGDAPATIITAYQAFLQRAESHPQYDGFETEVIYKNDKPFSATTKVYRKDRNRPTSWTVLFSEYSTGKSNWVRMPDFMLRKVSLATSLRICFPTEFQGMYIQEEMEKNSESFAPIKPENSSAANSFLSEPAEKKKPVKKELTTAERIIKAAESFKKINQLDVYNDIISTSLSSYSVAEISELSDETQVELLEIIMNTYKEKKAAGKNAN